MIWGLSNDWAVVYTTYSSKVGVGEGLSTSFALIVTGSNPVRINISPVEF